MNKEEILNTFLLANIPEIITQEEFNDVKKAIKELQQENKQLKSILVELEEWLKETRINSAFIDEQTIIEVQLKIQELKEKYK